MKKLLFFIAIFILTACTSNNKKVPVTPETALERYLSNSDDNYKWEVKESFDLDGLTAVDILLTSQNWRDHIWTHQLTLFIPDEVHYDGALLFITGGSVKNGLPNWNSIDDEWSQNFARVALKNKGVVAIVRQTPNQPLYNDLVEDELISFTLHNFKQDNDYTWPLLFPMVKTAVRAMDAVQEYCEENLESKITRFTVSGASKRGWTTWLTASQDERVEAIGPMVIDVLNMPVSLDYHLEAWDEYSIQIEDYTKLEIPQSVNTESGNAISTMVDPYSYRKSLSMPKMIFIGTNDEYWPVDAVKNYIDEIPGENYIHYVPNAGHDLGGGEQALKALSAFWGRTLEKDDYPDYSYTISADSTFATLHLSYEVDELKNIYMWSAVSTDRDFRDEEWSAETVVFEENKIAPQIHFPEKGYKAFYIDLEYQDPKGGTYTKSTRMYVVNSDEVL